MPVVADEINDEFDEVRDNVLRNTGTYLFFYFKLVDSDDYDGIASSPLKARQVAKPGKKKRGDERA